jgi:hypothetical protein
MRRNSGLAALCVFAGLFQGFAQEPTAQERKRAADELRASRRVFLDAVTGLSKGQLSFKAGPDRWSIQECAEHIALAEDGYFGTITKRLLHKPAEPGQKAAVKDDDVLRIMTDRTAARTATEPLQPGRKGASMESILAHFEASRQRFIGYIENTHDDLRGHLATHRAMGLIDGYQWILLASGHCRRHTMQIEEVKAEPRFPKR